MNPETEIAPGVTYHDATEVQAMYADAGCKITIEQAAHKIQIHRARYHLGNNPADAEDN